MDLELKETGNGGDLIKNPKDLSVISGFENMPYLAIFGGNVKASTPTRRLDTEQAFDFWGNNLLMPNDSGIQFNSETERLLNNVAITPFGRVLILQAVKKDVAFMSDFGIVSVSVNLLSLDRIAIGIQIKRPDNLQDRTFFYIWDATLRELLDREFVINKDGTVTPVDGGSFDDSFEPSFE